MNGYVFWVSLIMAVLMAVDLSLTPRSSHDDLKGLAMCFFFVSAIVALATWIF